MRYATTSDCSLICCGPTTAIREALRTRTGDDRTTSPKSRGSTAFTMVLPNMSFSALRVVALTELVKANDVIACRAVGSLLRRAYLWIKRSKPRRCLVQACDTDLVEVGQCQRPIALSVALR